MDAKVISIYGKQKAEGDYFYQIGTEKSFLNFLYFQFAFYLLRLKLIGKLDEGKMQKSTESGNPA